MRKVHNIYAFIEIFNVVFEFAVVFYSFRLYE